MLNRRKRSISYTPLYVSLLVILTMASFIGVYWSIDKYFSYKQTISDIHERYNETYRTRLKEEMSNVFEFIEYKKHQSEQTIETQLQQKVHIAYVTASHLYSLYKSTMSKEDIRSMVIEALRPIRWDRNLGYFFAGDVRDGKFYLVADRPSFEGQIMYDYQDADGNFMVREMINLVTEQGAGLVTYKWRKPEEGADEFLKISFVRHFGPFNWFLGAGVYANDIVESIQNDVLERIEEIQFAQYGSIACVRADGQTIIDFNKPKKGRSVVEIKDDDGQPFGQKILDVANSDQKEGFIKSIFEKPDTGQKSHRISYVRTYDEWGWTFITSMYENEMMAAIDDESKKYRSSIFRDIIMFMIIFTLTVLIVLVIAYFYSLRIRHAIDLFTDFFKDAADKKIKLEDANLTFDEFVSLGKFANQMVVDRNLKDKLLKRDELRLDTLFNLSMMQHHTLEEVCEFTLQRSLIITDSTLGYIALVIDEKYFEITCLVQKTGEKFVTHYSVENIPLDSNTSCSQAYSSRQPVLRNKGKFYSLIKHQVEGGEEIIRHLDVPVMDGDKVVAVIGVCNKHEDYVDLDIHQLAILQEGMWHQILKSKSEKELIRLRNLLKGINDSMPSMIIGVDKSNEIMQWNRQAELITGLSAKHVEGEKLHEVYPRLKSYVPLIEDVITTGVPRNENNVSWEFDGEKRYESVSIFPLFADQVNGAVIRIDDITEKVRLEDMMVQSEKMLSVGGLAAGMAHEINNPLAGIMQNLQVARTRLVPNFKKNVEVANEKNINMDDVAEYIEARGINQMFESIDQSAKRAAVLVQNMLSFSRKSDYIFSTEGIPELMESTIELVSNDYDLKKKFDFKKIDIQKEYADDVPVIPCESTNIQQVFLNILKNGAYAIAEKDYGSGKPKLLIRISKNGQMVRIEIEDDGPGIDEETKKRIFEPFYTTKPVGVGTGLGLSISYFIIHEQHKGTLEVLSELGKGAKFIVELPTVRGASS